MKHSGTVLLSLTAYTAYTWQPPHVRGIVVNSICGLLKTSPEEEHGEDVNHRLQEGRHLSDSEEEGKAISEEKKKMLRFCAGCKGEGNRPISFQKARRHCSRGVHRPATNYIMSVFYTFPCLGVVSSEDSTG